MTNDTSNDDTTAGKVDDQVDEPAAGDRPPTNNGSRRTVEVDKPRRPRRPRKQAAGKVDEPAAGKVDEPAGGKVDEPAADKPRKRSTSTVRRRSLKPQLVELVTAAGTGLVIAGAARPALGYDGGIILDNADRLADELVKLGKRNPTVQRALESLVTTSEFGGSLLVFGAVLVPIAANHGLLPREVASLVGAPVPPPRPTSPPADDDEPAAPPSP